MCGKGWFSDGSSPLACLTTIHLCFAAETSLLTLPTLWDRLIIFMSSGSEEGVYLSQGCRGGCPERHVEVQEGSYHCKRYVYEMLRMWPLVYRLLLCPWSTRTRVLPVFSVDRVQVRRGATRQTGRAPSFQSGRLRHSLGHHPGHRATHPSSHLPSHHPPLTRRLREKQSHSHLHLR